MTVELSDRAVEYLDLLRLYWPGDNESKILRLALECYCEYLAIDLGLFDFETFKHAWRRYHCYEDEV